MENNCLKIAMICLHSSPVGDIGTQDTGGMSVYVRELSKELGRLGHYVDIYTRTNSESCPRIMTLCERVRIIHLSVRDSNHLSKLELHPLIPEFLSSLENFRSQEKISYDLIYSHYWLSGILGEWARELWKVPHLIMFHTLGALKNSCGMGQQEPELRISAEKKLAELSSGIIMASNRERKNFMRYYGAALEKTALVPCGVQFEIFRPIESRKARFNLGLSLKEKVILYVGRLDPLKGIERLMKAFTLLSSRNSVRLIIVGENGCPESGLEKIMRDLGIRKSVSFFERVDHNLLPLYYSAADVLAVPSLYESFGLVALEALACGTPVVATPVGCMEKIIIKGETGLVTSDFSVQALAEALNFYVSGKNNTSPETIRSSIVEYTWSRSAKGVLRFFNEVISEHPKERSSEQLFKSPFFLKSYAYEKQCGHIGYKSTSG